jgi:hypothetical protein
MLDFMKTLITTIGILVVMSAAASTISLAVQASAQPMNTTVASTNTTVPQGNVTAGPTGPMCPPITITQEALSELMEGKEPGTSCSTYCCAICTACALRDTKCADCRDNCHAGTLTP